MTKTPTLAVLLMSATLAACGGTSEKPKTVIAIAPEQAAQEEVEGALGELNECFTEAEGDARVQRSDCFNLTKDDGTTWDDRIREFGDCVESGRSREDCY